MEKNTKIMIAVGAVLLATAIFSIVASGKGKTFEDLVAEKYPGYKIMPIPDTNNGYLLLSKDFVIVVTQNENIFGNGKVTEILKVANIK
jgi:hypothetical protein